MSAERRSSTATTLARHANRPDRESPPGVPRWVKIFAIVAVIVILLAIAAMILVGGEHGPERHMHGGHTAALALAPFVDA
jgi:hypothetical protein